MQPPQDVPKNLLYLFQSWFFFWWGFLYLMNNWDKELIQFKLQSKVNCTKFKTCHFNWSPEVSFCISRRWLLACVKVYVMGLGPSDPQNLIRDCLRLHIFDPRCVSYSDVMIQTKIVHHKLSELATDAPALRHQHLLNLQKAADDRGDSTCLAIILKILTREQETGKWHRINYTTRPWGGNPLTVRVQVGPVVNKYDTEQEAVDHTSDHLSECFHLAYSALCYQGQLSDNLGFMGDTECSKQILEGRYEYPPDTDIWMKKILQEAHFTISHMSSAKIATTISTADFQLYWMK